LLLSNSNICSNSSTWPYYESLFAASEGAAATISAARI
jgi:hypothetical protein